MKKILIGFVLTMLLACGSGHKYSDTNKKALDTIVTDQLFEINSNRALPQMTVSMQQLGNAGLLGNGSTAGSIDLSTNTNYLRIKNDSVMANLPFYGERHFGGGYNNSAGIEFEGIAKNLDVQKGKESSYEIRFDIRDKNLSTETYRVNIKLFPDLSSTININSSGRSNIQYRGHVHALNDK